MIKSLYCEDISVEYEFKSEKFKGCIDQLKVKRIRPKWKHNGIKNITDSASIFKEISFSKEILLSKRKI